MSDSRPSLSLWAWPRWWLVRLWRNLQWRALAWAQMVYLGAVVLVLALTPSSYQAPARQRLAQHMVLCTAPILPGFTLLAAFAVAYIGGRLLKLERDTAVLIEIGRAHV